MQAHFQLDQRATQALGACAQLQSDQTDVTLQVARAPITDSLRVCEPTAGGRSATARRCDERGIGSWNPLAGDSISKLCGTISKCDNGARSPSFAFGATLAEHARATVHAVGEGY